MPTGGAALDAGGGVVNGGFDVADPAAAGFGWQTHGGAAVEDGHGVLTETTSLASRFMQELVAPADAHVLTFTIVSMRFDPSGLGPQDAFEVALLDPQSMQSLAGGIGLADTDALLNLQADGSVYSASTVHLTPAADGSTLVRIDLGGLPAGQALRLYFDLLGSGALGSRVVIDDVQFSSGVAPVAEPDSVTTAEDTPVTFDPRSNDSSPSGRPLTVELTSGAAHGVGRRARRRPCGLHARRRLLRARTASSTASATASRSLPVAVTSTVTRRRRRPGHGRYGGDDAQRTRRSTGTLTATDVDSTTLTFHVVDGPQHGTLVLDAPGAYTYTPAANYNGADSFTYAANDGTLDSNVGTVSLTVTRGERRSGRGRRRPRRPPRTRRSPATLTATDVDSTTLTFHVVDGPLHGTLVLDPAGSFTYTPAPDFNGADGFTYTANDGLARLERRHGVADGDRGQRRAGGAGSVGGDRTRGLRCSGTLVATDVDSASLTYIGRHDGDVHGSSHRRRPGRSPTRRIRTSSAWTGSRSGPATARSTRTSRT